MSKGYYGYGNFNSNQVGGGFSQKDAQKATNTTRKNTSRAYHDARNDAAKEGGHGVPKDRHSSRKKK